MRFKPGARNDFRSKLKVDRNHGLNTLAQVRIKIRLHGGRVNVPDHLTKQLLTAPAKPCFCLPVDISKAPFTIELVIQISNALENVRNLPARLAQRRQRLVALANRFASLKLMQAG